MHASESPCKAAHRDHRQSIRGKGLPEDLTSGTCSPQPSLQWLFSLALFFNSKLWLFKKIHLILFLKKMGGSSLFHFLSFVLRNFRLLLSTSFIQGAFFWINLTFLFRPSITRLTLHYYYTSLKQGHLPPPPDSQ